MRVTNLDERGAGIKEVSAGVTPDGAGIVTRSMDEPPMLEFAGGVTVKGFAATFASGDALDIPTTSCLVLLVCSAGSSTIIHEDAGTSAAQQVTTHNGADVVLGTDPKPLYYRHDGSAWRWVLGS
jgi:hypothetical protein